ncbi:MAG: ceramidase domain-containing protein [Leptospiraceae bacterium]|nr:ceramidase domain-containing protein [Leptospiraceae bacterium]
MTIEPLSLGCPWSNFLPPTIQFCERNLCSYITTPANTWSNLSYIFIGIFLLFKIRKKNTPRYLTLFPIAAILTGIASFLYHASFTFLFQFFDLSSMYLFSCILLVLNWQRIRPLEISKLISLFFILILSSIILLYFFKKYGILIFGLHLVIAICLEYRIYLSQKSSKFSGLKYYTNFLFAIFCFFLALFIWILDFKKIICYPDNHILQGHAVWHILTSFCYLFLFRFYDEIKSI